ncbi:flavin reductase (DIM6/NTAB) family NADH-FMN oxidoreductase RutF [Flavobacteriaceae bacterium MAR_2010_72]|nr:flavin reductase (DIM6/NTAB) family NADH-FMN oxidoreductase RutF [Flavobacteriaceae bacterium MAR_2010_72]TVZ60013.1 flavin reductase (DIM6/NTAB) family NADH-FMN oxidoreductase RutF [Flavobacteriaceae bacterium MAR_2010_105]
MPHFNRKDIDQMDYLFRINLINCCSGYKSANLIGTKSKDGYENIAIFSSITHIGSSPPMLGFFLRPTTVVRNTYDNIKETGYYSINHVHQNVISDAHHTSAKYAKEISEFDSTNLKSDYKDGNDIPFLKDAPIQILMKLIEEYHIKANDTILVIGEIQELYIKELLLGDDGFINLSKGHVAAVNGLDGYCIPESPIRFEYQRPKQVLK